MNNKALVGVGVVLGLVFFVIGYVYATHSAGALPTFFPGYLAGTNNVHTKHSIGAFVVGVGSFVYAWFQSGPQKAV